ncbi:MAG: hypothetical protein QOG15_136 [Solirubrobacteraceae bacterium]|jgi:hypothetical protein|nr:hypothetical protein [Solirubrobacteraceae bacterium]
MSARSLSVAAVFLAAVGLSACFGSGDKAAKASSQPTCTPAAGPAPATLKLAPQWAAGDTRKVTITKTREESGQPSTESGATAQLTVLRTGVQGSRLRWTSNDAVLPADQLPSVAAARLKDVAKGFVVRYTTDAGGAYVAKQNVAQIHARLAKILDALAQDPASAAAVKSSRAVMLSTPFIQTSVVKEIPELHGVYGLTLTEAKPLKLTRRIANPFGATALRADGTAELVQARNDRGCAIVELDVKPTAAELAKSLADTFGAKATNVPQAARRAGLSVESSSRYTYDPATGWVVRVDVTQTVKINGKSGSDLTVITTRGPG